MTRYLKLYVLFLSFLLAAENSWAHRVNIFAYVEGDQVHTESYFSDGRAVVDGSIEVYDMAGKKLGEGKVDGQGFFSFRLPKKEDLKIVINDSMGHKNEYLLKEEEM